MVEKIRRVPRGGGDVAFKMVGRQGQLVRPVSLFNRGGRLMEGVALKKLTSTQAI